MLEKREHPRELIDPAGEGIYLRAGLDDIFAIPSPNYRAAHILLGCATRWRALDVAALFMGPGEDGETYERKRFRWWHGFLPERRWPFTTYLYFTPKPEAM